MSHQSSLSLIVGGAADNADVYTGALAPAAFRKAVATWVEEGKTRQLPSSSLMLVEIDWFARPKRSELGTALRIVADIIRPRLRSSDVVGRIDDHTIGILLPTTPPFHTERVARRVVAAVSARTPSTGHPLTVSVGLSSALVDRPWENAAQALADARNAGGDRAATAPDAPLVDAAGEEPLAA